MLGGLQNGSGITCEQYWKNMQIGFKYLSIITIAIGLMGIVTNLFTYVLIDRLVWTVNKFQIWRLLTSFMVDTSILNVIFNIYILSTCMPSIEQTYSTAYIIVEIFMQTFVCNIIFVVGAQISSLSGLVNQQLVVNFGLSQLMFIFLWQRAAMNPEQLTRFCFFPCVMPMKYLPWCFFLFSLLFGANIGMTIGCLIGYYQHMVINRPLIRLPLSIYNKVENILPKSTKENPGFVSIRKVQASLLTICRTNNSSFQAADNNQAMNDTVEVLGRGVQIGGESLNYKSYWAQQENSDQPQNNTQEQPKTTQKIQQEEDKNEDNAESSRNLLINVSLI